MSIWHLLSPTPEAKGQSPADFGGKGARSNGAVPRWDILQSSAKQELYFYIL
jgi:hypothetical protein